MADFNADLRAGVKAFENIVTEVEDEIAGALGIADEALPYVTKVMTVAGAIATLVPGGQGIGALLATAANFVTDVEKYVKGADGVIATADKAIGKATPLTPAEKRQFVADQTAMLHPDAATHQVDLATTIAFVDKTKIQAAPAA